jgi:hypothetical protein
MNQKLSLVVGCTVLSASLAQTDVYGGCRCLRKPASDRGIAVLAPVESPDPCDEPVGGQYFHTPYYPGYAPDRRCPVQYVSPFTYGVVTTGPYVGNAPGSAKAGYGTYTGGSQDEASLMRLGGSGPSSQVPYRPLNEGSGDLIDKIQGNR